MTSAIHVTGFGVPVVNLPELEDRVDVLEQKLILLIDFINQVIEQQNRTTQHCSKCNNL